MPVRKPLSILLGLLAVIALTLAGCGLFTLDSPVDCDSDTFYGYKATLPANAQGIVEKCSNDFNPSYEASFTIPATDVPAFQATTRVTEWARTAPENSVVGQHARGATSVLYGTSSDGAIYEQVLIDVSAPDRAKVYLQLVNVD